ncbi:MAG: hypothetical protein K0S29_772 [Gammaproteobacteria bacterium]|jgi:hypothetical protein|nr:hypothetical protein [Gammaproteobacteria bacterium]
MFKTSAEHHQNMSLELLTELQAITPELIREIDSVLRVNLEDYNLLALKILADITKEIRDNGPKDAAGQPALPSVLDYTTEEIELLPFDVDSFTGQKGLILKGPSVYRSTPLNLSSPSINKTASEVVYVFASIYDVFYISCGYLSATYLEENGAPRFAWLDKDRFSPQNLIMSILKYFLVKNGDSDKLDKIHIDRLNALGCNLEKPHAIAKIRAEAIPAEAKTRLTVFITTLFGEENVAKIKNLYECLKIMSFISLWQSQVNQSLQHMQNGEILDSSIIDAMNFSLVFDLLEARISYQRKLLSGYIKYYSSSKLAPQEAAAPNYHEQAVKNLEKIEKAAKKIASAQRKIAAVRSGQALSKATLSTRISGSTASYASFTGGTVDAAGAGETAGSRGGAASSGGAAGSGGAAAGSSAIALSGGIRAGRKTPMESLNNAREQARQILAITSQINADNLFVAKLFPQGIVKLSYDIDRSRAEKGIVLCLKKFGPTPHYETLKFENLAEVLFSTHPTIASFVDDLRLILQLYLQLVAKDPSIPKLSETEFNRLKTLFPGAKTAYYKNKLVADMETSINECFPNPATRNAEAKALWQHLSCFYALEVVWKKALSDMEELFNEPPVASQDFKRLFSEYNIPETVTKISELAADYLGRLHSEITSLTAAINAVINGNESFQGLIPRILENIRKMESGEIPFNESLKAGCIAELRAYIGHLSTIDQTPLNFKYPSDSVIRHGIEHPDDNSRLRCNDLKVDLARLAKLKKDRVDLSASLTAMLDDYTVSQPNVEAVARPASAFGRRASVPFDGKVAVCDEDGNPTGATMTI